VGRLAQVWVIVGRRWGLSRRSAPLTELMRESRGASQPQCEAALGAAQAGRKLDVKAWA